MIVYLHHYPAPNHVLGHKWFHSPMPMDYSQCGYYSDRIFNMHGEAKRFYIATFGYNKSWNELNTYERVINRFTLHFVFAGKGLFNGKPVKAGNVFVAPQKEKHTIIQDSEEPMTYGWIALSGTELENQLSLLHLSEMPMITVFQNQDVIQKIFLDTVYGEHPNVDLESYLFSKFHEIMAYCNPVLPQSQEQEDLRTNLYFSEILNYVETHYSKNITISDIAKHVHISPSYLHRICSQKANTTPLDLVSQKRLSVAKSMLANSEASVGEIALFVGFSNPNAFSKFFTKNCGLSAQAYRQQQIEMRKQNTETILQTEQNWKADEERRQMNISKPKHNN